MGFFTGKGARDSAAKAIENTITSDTDPARARSIRANAQRMRAGRIESYRADGGELIEAEDK